MKLKRPSLHLHETNKHLGSIVGVGLALGVGNYALGASPTLGQSLVQQVAISMVIGYLLLHINYHEDEWFGESVPDWQRKVGLSLLFAIVGLLGSEVLQLVNHLMFG